MINCQIGKILSSYKSWPKFFAGSFQFQCSYLTIFPWSVWKNIEVLIQYNWILLHNYSKIFFKYTSHFQALLANNTDGLDINYFRIRLRQWVDVPAVVTGWFLGPKDSSFLLESLKELTGDGKFCRVFDVYDHSKWKLMHNMSEFE